MSNRLPDFVIIGAQKSASSFIQGCIAEHPGVFMAPGEIPFFEDPDYDPSKLSQVTQLFSDADTEQLLGLKRPNYLGRPEVAPRLKQHMPNAKLIVVLRNPVARALSSYFHNMKLGFIPIENPEIGMLKVLNGDWDRDWPRNQEILEYGLYAKHLSHYLNYFKRENILVMLHEHVATDNLAAVKTAYKFLGLDDSFVPTNFMQRRPQAVVYSIPRLRILRFRNRFIFNYNKDLTRLERKSKLNLLEKLVFKSMRILDRLVLSKVFDNSKPVLSSELKSRIYEYYEDDINQLQEIVKQDLSIWRR